MLTRRTKSLGILTVLVGAPSSISLSNIDLSRLSLEHLFSSSGGAKARRGDSDYGLDQKIKVGDSIKNLGNFKQKEILSPEIIEVKESLDLSNQKVVDGKNLGSTAQTTYSEITKEEKALILNSESANKVNNALPQSKKWISDYRSGKQKLDAYISRQNGVTPKRGKRHTQSTNSTTLTIKERKALQEIYKIFEQLNKDKGELVPRLKKISGTETISMPLSAIPQSSEFSRHLQAIGWTTSKDLRYTTEGPRLLGKKPKPNEWANWDKNPYKKFIDSKEQFEGLVKALKDADSQMQSYLSRNIGRGFFSMFAGPGTVRSTYSEKGQYDSLVGDAKSAFANEVAKKLLIWMGQAKP